MRELVKTVKMPFIYLIVYVITNGGVIIFHHLFKLDKKRRNTLSYMLISSE